MVSIVTRVLGRAVRNRGLFFGAIRKIGEAIHGQNYIRGPATDRSYGRSGV